MAQRNVSSNVAVRHRFSASSVSFLTQFGVGASGSGGVEQEMDVILLDHCYSKPWSAHPDASNARPLRMLFMPKQTRPEYGELIHRNIDSPVNVTDAPPAPSMPFDINKARNLMTECERHASYARPDSQDDWEERISKSGWTIQQNRAFTKVIKALQADRLARLAMDSIANEPIARRQLVDKTAKRLRQALASVGWDMNVAQWLHQLILDSVSIHLLAGYLDALQTLKSKVPSLVEKMVSGAPPKHPSLSQESLVLLLKKPWDPIGSVLTQTKLKRLPSNPLLLLAPSGPTQGSHGASGQAKRLKFWQAHLNSMGKTITVNMSGGSGVSMVLCMEQMIGALRTKVLEQKSHSNTRPIVLVGWNIGALVSCHVSLIETVQAVICLGFPFTGIEGSRGGCEDPMLGSQTPTLFVVGQNASDCSIDQLQDLREHMRAETGMLVVGGADEQLRLSHRQKREEGLTQAMADRCVIDEVYQFLGSILSMASGCPDSNPAEMAQIDLRRKKKRKLSRDVMGAYSLDCKIAATVDPSIGTAPVLSTSAGRMSKRGGKAARLMAAVGGTSLPAERSRPAPKKRQARGGLASGARKRMAVNVSQLGMQATKSAALQSAVSSAPELYGLLQGLRSSEGESVGISGSRSLMTAAFPHAKLLAFSKMKEDGNGKGSVSAPGPATLLASAMRSGDNSDKDKVAQQQQILVRTGGSSGTPITIPISMAPRLVPGNLAVTSPLVHITGTGSSTASQIHQLLTTSTTRSSVSTTSATVIPQTAFLINTSAALSCSSSATKDAEKTPDTAGEAEKEAGHKSQEKDGMQPKLSEVGKKDDGLDSLPSVQSSQYHDFPLTTASLTNASAVLPQVSITTPTMVLTQASLTNPTTVLIQTKTGDTRTGPTTVSITKPTVMQLAVSKSLINPGKVITSNVAQPGPAGSAAATTSVLGGRSAVLISTSVARGLTSSSTTTLLSKASAESGSPSTTYVLPVEQMLGKVSSILEPNASTRRAGQPPVGTASLVAGPFSLIKTGVISVTKPPTSSGFTSTQTASTSAPGSSSSSTGTTFVSPSTTAPVGAGTVRGGPKSTTSVSYASSAKPVLPTVASTRTRRIRTPKQYDL